MTTNFYSANSRPFSLVRSYTPSAGRFLAISSNQRFPQAKDSRPMQKIIMKQMDQSKDYKMKLISHGIEIQKNQWLRKIQRVYGDINFSRGTKIIVKDLDRVKVSGRDILAVSINDFDRKPRYALSSTPLKSQSEKNLLKKHPDSLHIRKNNNYNSLSKSFFVG
jgi:hypothetical protein